jgi:hypothetical protein
MFCFSSLYSYSDSSYSTCSGYLFLADLLEGYYDILEAYFDTLDSLDFLEA